MLKFAFLIGIVFISFNIIWFLFSSLLKMVLGETGNIEKYILRVSQSYFLASVTALATINYAADKSQFHIFVSIAAVILFFYLINKIEKRKKLMQFNLGFNKDYVSFNSSGLKYDVVIAVLTVGFFLYAVYYPLCVQNGLNDWLFNAINKLYNSFFIGDIIGIIGVFFILGIFIKGFVSFQTLYRQFSEMINGKSKPGFDEKEGFTEYEIVEDDDPEDIQLIEETE